MKVEFQKRSLLTITFLISFYVGVWIGIIYQFPHTWILPYLCIVLFFLTIVILVAPAAEKRCKLLFTTCRTYLLCTLCICIGSFCGYMLSTHHLQSSTNAPLYEFSDKKVSLIGIICDAPDKRIYHTKLHVCIEHIEFPVSKSITGSVLLSVSKFQQFNYGSRIHLQGTLVVPMEDETFSYRNYLLKDGITHLMSRPTITLLETSQGNPIWQYTFLLRETIEGGINSIWHEPDASFLAGLLIGSRKGIPEELMDNFQRTGLTHIIAISGYNITLLIVIVTSLFSFLSKRVQIISSIIVILIFTLLVGASSAVVRAALMGILGLLALLFHRKSTVLITILLSGALMLLGKPLLLLYDVGYQLSFLAVLGLLYMDPILQPFITFLPERWGIREGFSLTISATITTTPAILYHFGVFSSVSPVANVLVGPFLPFAMLFGFLSLITTFCFPLLGFVLQLCTSFCLQAVITIANIGGAIPGGFVEVQRLTPLGVAISYGLLLIILFLHRSYLLQKNEEERKTTISHPTPTTSFKISAKHS